MPLLRQLAILFTERHERLDQAYFASLPLDATQLLQTDVTFAFQVPVTWEGAGEASARHVVERHAFSAITRCAVAA